MMIRYMLVFETVASLVVSCVATHLLGTGLLTIKIIIKASLIYIVNSRMVELFRYPVSNKQTKQGI